jgi:hypothetical protein
MVSPCIACRPLRSGPAVGRPCLGGSAAAHHWQGPGFVPDSGPPLQAVPGRLPQGANSEGAPPPLPTLCCCTISVEAETDAPTPPPSSPPPPNAPSISPESPTAVPNDKAAFFPSCTAFGAGEEDPPGSVAARSNDFVKLRRRAHGQVGPKQCQIIAF